MPVAVKDNICTLEFTTSCGSKILEGYRSPYDATAVAKLKAAGALVAGKTNCDEFGMGSSTEHSAYGRALHPFDRSEEHTSELQSQSNLVCRLLLEKKQQLDRLVHGGYRHVQPLAQIVLG